MSTNHEVPMVKKKAN